MAKFALARTEEPLSVEQESGAELKQEALQVLEQLEYSRSEAQRMVDEIFSRHKNLKTTEDFLRRVFEQLHPGNRVDSALECGSLLPLYQRAARSSVHQRGQQAA